MSNCGAAYVFRNNGSDDWVQEAKLLASDKAANDNFGLWLDIDGGTAGVGAYADDSLRGSAYIFHRASDGQGGFTWEQKKKVIGSQCSSGDYFGRSVALWGDRLIVGAYHDEAAGGTSDTGSAYAYNGLEGGRTVQTWNLDAVGNWSATAVNGVTQERNINSGNEIISLEGADDTTDIDIAHDPAGNMTTMPRLPMPGYEPGRLLCQYDAWGRLAAVWEDTSLGANGEYAGGWDGGDPGAPGLAEYQYDPASQDGLRGAGSLGRRTAKIVRQGAGSAPGGAGDQWRRTDYYYDESWRVVEERATAGAVSYALAGAAATVADEIVYAQYLYDPGRGDTPICRFRDADGDAGQEGGNGLEETLFYLTDANGNVTALVRPDGTVVERYMYDAYGQVHVLNGSNGTGNDPDGASPRSMDQWTLDPDNVSDWDNEVLFSGYRRDGETGLYQARNRYYHSVLGNFITRDPAGFVDGMNLTQYCQSNPINATDPTGLFTLDDKPREIVVGKKRYRQTITYAYSLNPVAWYYGNATSIANITHAYICDVSPDPAMVDVVGDSNVCAAMATAEKASALANAHTALRIPAETLARLSPYSDLYEVLTGRDCISGERLAIWERSLAGFGIGFRPGQILLSTVRIGKIVDAINDARKGEKALSIAVGSESMTDLCTVQRMFESAAREAGDDAAQVAKLQSLLDAELAKTISGTMGDGATVTAKDIRRATEGMSVVARVRAKLSLYPKIIDPRSGRHIAFPSP